MNKTKLYCFVDESGQETEGRLFKVQGVTKDENNSLVRFADAVAGFVRDVLDGDREEAKKLFEQVVKAGALVECEP